MRIPLCFDRRRAFTLVELLVVVSIIVVLVAMLVPSMEKAFSLAQRASCAAQLHAQCIALKSYAIDDIGKRYPEPVTPASGGNWPDGAMIIDWGDPGPRRPAGQPVLFVKGYAPDATLFYCPANAAAFNNEALRWGPTSEDAGIRADPWASTYVQYAYWSGGFWSGSDPGRSLDEITAVNATTPGTTIMLTDNITMDVGADFVNTQTQTRNHDTDRRDTTQTLDGTTFTNGPDGGNILTNDGGAFWRNFSETRLRLQHPQGQSYERDWFW